MHELSNVLRYSRASCAAYGGNVTPNTLADDSSAGKLLSKEGTKATAGISLATCEPLNRSIMPAISTAMACSSTPDHSVASADVIIKSVLTPFCPVFCISSQRGENSSSKTNGTTSGKGVDVTVDVTVEVTVVVAENVGVVVCDNVAEVVCDDVIDVVCEDVADVVWEEVTVLVADIVCVVVADVVGVVEIQLTDS